MNAPLTHKQRAWSALLILAAILGSAPARALDCSQAPAGYGCNAIDAQGALSTRVHGINNSGAISGYVERPGAVVLRANSPTLLGQLTPIGPFGSAAAFGFGLNNAGDVAGYSLGANGYSGFMWDGTDYTNFQFAGAQTFAYGINASRTIVGAYQTAPNAYAGFVMAGGAFSPVSLAGARSTYLYGVNDAGSLAGTYVNSSGEIVGFQGTPGAFQDVRAPGARQTYVRGINNIGDVVGSYVDSVGSTKGFARLSDGTFWTFSVADALRTHLMGINDARDVVGYYHLDEFFAHGLVAQLKPIPLPPAVLLLGAGLALLGTQMRRRSALRQD